jgi:hypothetical protein
MKGITELKNLYLNDDIYILASGASMNHIDPSFFENKITIGVNQVFKKFKCDYIVRKEASQIPESIKSGADVICSTWDSGDINKGKRKKNRDFHPTLDFYTFDHLDNGHTNIDFSILGTDKIVVSYSTITSAIHMAAYMGAKNIMIAGHDCGVINDKYVFDGYYDNINETPWKDWNAYVQWLSVIEDQTKQIKDRLIDFYGCNIMSINPFINYNLEGNKFNGKNKIN